MATSQHLKTARAYDYQSPFASCLSSSATTIMNNLSQSIGAYQQNLVEFTCFIEQSVRKNQAIKCKCCDVLGASLAKLKQNFAQFANQWKLQLPTICAQFMEIVRKICMLYQQEVQRLQQLNEKWEFSYKQLLNATASKSNPNTNDNSKAPSPTKDCPIQKIQRKYRTPLCKQAIQSRNNLNQQSICPVLTRTSKQIVNITDYLMKIKQSQLSLMKQQITELFEQQDRSDENSSHHKSKQKHLNCSKQKNKMIIKILTQEEKTNEEIKQFRLRTMSDQLIVNNNTQDGIASINSVNLHINYHNPTNSKDSISSKNSQQNSRKNSIVFKDQFWQNLKGNIGNKSNNLNKSIGKQNVNILSKQRSSIVSKQMKDDEKNEKNYQGSSGNCATGSKLQDLKRNMYKNKATIDWRA